MRLNKDCIRDIMLYIEGHCVYYNDPKQGHGMYTVTFKEISLTDELAQYSYDDKYYTVGKLFESRLIGGYVIPKNNFNNYRLAYIETISMHGHELLDNIRPKEVWDETKNVLHKVGDFSLGIMSQVAGEVMAAYTKRMLNLTP